MEIVYPLARADGPAVHITLFDPAPSAPPQGGSSLPPRPPKRSRSLRLGRGHTVHETHRRWGAGAGSAATLGAPVSGVGASPTPGATLALRTHPRAPPPVRIASSRPSAADCEPSLRLVRDDLVADLLVGRFRDDLLLPQLVLGLV